MIIKCYPYIFSQHASLTEEFLKTSFQRIRPKVPFRRLLDKFELHHGCGSHKSQGEIVAQRIRPIRPQDPSTAQATAEPFRTRRRLVALACTSGMSLRAAPRGQGQGRFLKRNHQILGSKSILHGTESASSQFQGMLYLSESKNWMSSSPNKVQGSTFSPSLQIKRTQRSPRLAGTILQKRSKSI